MKIAFIDHIFHKKTQSSIFFVDILKNDNQIDFFWHESWIGDDFIKINEINNNNYDLIIFWQIIAKPYQIKKLKCKNIIWVPMYDTEILRLFYKLQTIGYLKFGIKIISFSHALSNKLAKIGFNTLTVKYYPLPKSINKNNNNLNVLFWQRIEKIDFKIVKKLLNGNKINKIFYKNNPDPKQNITVPNQKNMEIINEWMSDEDYKKLLDQCDIYIAPRKYEGIGMSFLNAMASGLLIISPDKPTANEYIEDKYNGYLYDINNPQPIDLSNIQEMRKNLEKSLRDGYGNWKKQEKDILEFIKPKKHKINREDILLYLVYSIYSPILEKLRKIKRLLKIKFY